MDLLDRLDHHEQCLEDIVHPSPSQRVMHRMNTGSLIEKLDKHSVEVERLLQEGASVLADGGLTNQCDLELECDCSFADVDDLSDTGSTTASSCGDSSARSSPRSFVLASDDEVVQKKAAAGRFNLWPHKELSTNAHQLVTITTTATVVAVSS